MPRDHGPKLYMSDANDMMENCALKSGASASGQLFDTTH